MAKTEVLDWNDFFKGEITVKQSSPGTIQKFVPVGMSGLWYANKALTAYAATPNDAAGLGKLMAEMLSIADYVAWGGLIFAGASWMFNNRTVAIERGIGVTAGYLIIRKSWDYVQFLKGV